MAYEIPSLPYKYSDLEPHFDEATMRLHHTKHHQAYTDKLNTALEKYPELFNRDLSELLRSTEQLPEDIRTTVVNNGGGYLNHNFFWETLQPSVTGENLPTGTSLGVLLEDQYGSVADFLARFKETALGIFGSGWAWLALVAPDKVEIMTTANQGILSAGISPLLAVDVWEHAYYLKYQNRRAEYIDAFFKVLNWSKAEERFKMAIK